MAAVTLTEKFTKIIQKVGSAAYHLLPETLSDYVRHKAGTGSTEVSLKSYLDAAIKSFSLSGKTITVTNGDGTTQTFTTQDTVYTLPDATGSPT